jgi:hypothetical protein
MSSFTNPFDVPLIVTDLGDGKHWQIAEPFEYHVGSIDSTEIIKVPVGFVTDFATIPRILWPIFPPAGKYAKAAVVHDYLTSIKGHLPGGKSYSKKQVDGIFLEAMGVLGVNIITRHIIWKAVSLFGDKSGYINS